jgi:hypothetical protein
MVLGQARKFARLYLNRKKAEHGGAPIIPARTRSIK